MYEKEQKKFLLDLVWVCTWLGWIFAKLNLFLATEISEFSIFDIISKNIIFKYDLMLVGLQVIRQLKLLHSYKSPVTCMRKEKIIII